MVLLDKTKNKPPKNYGNGKVYPQAYADGIGRVISLETGVYEG